MPFNSLNLSQSVGDAYSAVEQNRQIVCDHFGRSLKQLCFAQQVHGTHVETITSPSTPNNQIVADGLLTCQRELLVGVQVADCFPVLFACKTGAVVAAVHAGRKGIESGIIACAIDQLTEKHGVNHSDLLVGVGPGISMEHYEVDHVTAERFKRMTGKTGVCKKVAGRYHLDLRTTVHNQAVSSGVAIQHIEHMNFCTWKNADRFFSYRYSQGRCGRFGALIQRPSH